MKIGKQLREGEHLPTDIPDKPISDRHDALAAAIADEPRPLLPWILLALGLALLAGIAWQYGPVGDEPAAYADLLILCAATVPIVLGSLFLIADMLHTNFGTLGLAAFNVTGFVLFFVGGYLWLIHLLNDHGFLLSLAIAALGLVSILTFAKLFDLPVFVGMIAFLLVAALETALVILLDWLFALTAL